MFEKMSLGLSKAAPPEEDKKGELSERSKDGSKLKQKISEKQSMMNVHLPEGFNQVSAIKPQGSRGQKKANAKSAEELQKKLDAQRENWTKRSKILVNIRDRLEYDEVDDCQQLVLMMNLGQREEKGKEQEFKKNIEPEVKEMCVYLDEGDKEQVVADFCKKNSVNQVEEASLLKYVIVQIENYQLEIRSKDLILQIQNMQTGILLRAWIEKEKRE